MTAFPTNADFTARPNSHGNMRTRLGELRDATVGLLGADGTRTTALSTLGLPGSSRVSLSAATTLDASARGQVIDASGTWNLTLPDAATAGNHWPLVVRNAGAGVISILPAGSNVINGGSSVILHPGWTADILCAGAAWTARISTPSVFTASIQGLVPAPGAGTGRYLREDGTWVAVMDLGSDQTIAGTKTFSGLVIFSGGQTLVDSGFTLRDDVDTTKLAKFQLADISTGVSRVFTLPDRSGTVATLNGQQTFTGQIDFSASGIVFGSGTGSVSAGLGAGATVSGGLKNINVATSGLSGSTTNLIMGSSVSGAVSNISLHGMVYEQSVAPAVITGAATLSAANVQARVINYTGAAATVSLPTAGTLNGFWQAAQIEVALDVYVINTGSGTMTLAGATGVTILGAATVAAGASAHFKLRRAATATYIAMRVA